MIYGYIRVSTREQNETRQVLALMDFGVKKHILFTDKQSGKDFDRVQYRRLLKSIKSGDILVVIDDDNVSFERRTPICTIPSVHHELPRIYNNLEYSYYGNNITSSIYCRNPW